jgi:hypothetical protein
VQNHEQVRSQFCGKLAGLCITRLTGYITDYNVLTLIYSNGPMIPSTTVDRFNYDGDNLAGRFGAVTGKCDNSACVQGVGESL